MLPNIEQSDALLSTDTVSPTYNTSTAVLLKYTSLICLIVQYFAVIMLMRYSRTRRVEDKLFLTSSAVCSVEFVKTVVSLLAILVQERFSASGFLRNLYVNIAKQPRDCLKVSVPALLFMFQNNLVYIALSNLDAAIFQVLYQFKIITTSFFSVLILNQNFSRIQWFSFLLLFAGTALVAHSELRSNNGFINQRTTNQSDPNEYRGHQNISYGKQITTQNIRNSNSSNNAEHGHKNKSNIYLGIISVVGTSVLSGFAGVYYEKLLKQTSQTLWIRNIQLGSIGCLSSLIIVSIKDFNAVKNRGFFYGYDSFVIFVVLMQALGGLIISVVIKYASNILKGFATSIVIVLSCLVSTLFFDLDISFGFITGTSLVLLSFFFYVV